MFPNKKIGTKEEFWNYLQQRRKEESMLGCARKDETVEGQVIIDGEPTGILSRHAYGLLDVFTIESQENGEEFKLLRIRNPWGKTEWVGDWSDNSEEIEKYRKELDVYVEELEDDEKFEIGEEDGTFIINFEDWSTIYNKLYVTIDFPPSWTGFRFTDSWNKGNSGGLPMPSAGITAKDAQISWGKNPQYLINQNKNGTVEFFFSLAQNDGRIEGKYIFPFVEIIDPICLIIYPAEDGKAVSKFDGSKVNPAWISTVVEHKEVSLRAMLPKGITVSQRFVFGINGEFKNSLFLIEDHRVVYTAGHNVVVYNTEDKSQYFYAGSEGTQGITAISLSPNKGYIAICEKADKAQCSIFDTNTSRRRKTLTAEDLNSTEFISVAFSPVNERSNLITLSGEPDWSLMFWKWDKLKIQAQISVSVTGPTDGYLQATFNPHDPYCIVITGGGLYKYFRVKDTEIEPDHTQLNNKDEDLSSEFTCHCWSRDGYIIACTERGEIMMCESSGEFVTMIADSPVEDCHIVSI